MNTLQTWINESSRLVFFGGAGVSTESGIPDFRSPDGLYHQQYSYPPETILSHDFFYENPEEFYAELKQTIKSPTAVLVEKETQGPLKKVCFISNQVASIAIQEEQFVG